MKIEITAITIVRQPSGMDQIVLDTNLPEGAYPWKGNTSVVMWATRDSGEEYCSKNFPGVPFKVVP